MKIKKLTKTNRFKSWFLKKTMIISKIYAESSHPAFFELIKNKSISLPMFVNVRKKEDILKLIDSDKYRAYFYRAVNHTPGKIESVLPVKSRFRKLLDKVLYFISKQYVRIFQNKIYKEMLLFKATTKHINDLNQKMDEYIASTSVDYRLLRAVNLGIISEKNAEIIRKSEKE